MNIAIIGSGISGLTAACLLHRKHDITVFEANDYVGGHTHTIDVTMGDHTYAVDTGFIVFNRDTYPNFCRMIDQLEVEWQPTVMTFSVKCERTGLEYSAHSLNTFFGQRKNLLSPPFYRMLLDIFRFRHQFDRIIHMPPTDMDIGTFLKKYGYGRRFIEHFIIPMGSSLWSADPERFTNFPLQMFVRFFRNHGILRVRQPIQWRVIKGGSHQYVKAMTGLFGNRIRLSCPIRRIVRTPNHVEVTPEGESPLRFDQVVLAVHSDQALAVLDAPTDAEREILGSIPYQDNLTILHTDKTVLPERKKLWSSWNYLIPARKIARAALTYDMNILQSLRAPKEFCVTLNLPDAVNPSETIDRFEYSHPVYTPEAPAAQKRHAEISGVNRTHYCGAYWGNGFHEDGVNSALAACRWFDERL